MKHMITGNVVERTWKSGEKLAGADVEEREMQYLYPEGDSLVFMDNASYEQVSSRPTHSAISAGSSSTTPTARCCSTTARPSASSCPPGSRWTVIETEPGFKGDTANNVLKPAKCTTGVIVQVPIFINEGDVVRIDTRTGEYAERVAKK
jgi:elongation factor P